MPAPEWDATAHKINLNTNDPYKILGVTTSTTFDEIKKHYRALSKIYHPDRYTDETKRKQVEPYFKKINAAYEFLDEKFNPSEPDLEVKAAPEEKEQKTNDILSADLGEIHPLKRCMHNIAERLNLDDKARRDIYNYEPSLFWAKHHKKFTPEETNIFWAILINTLDNISSDQAVHERKRKQQINKNIDFKTYCEMYDRAYKYSHKSLCDLVIAAQFNLILVIANSKKIPHQFVTTLLKYLRPDVQQVEENDGISHLISYYQLSYATLKSAPKDLLETLADRNFHLFISSLTERFNSMKKSYFEIDSAVYDFTKNLQQNLKLMQNAKNAAPPRYTRINPIESLKTVITLDENDPESVKQWPIADRLWLNIMKLDKRTDIIASCDNSEFKFHLLQQFIKSRPSRDDSDFAQANLGSAALKKFDDSMLQFKIFLGSEQLNALENNILNKLKSESDRLAKEKSGQPKKGQIDKAIVEINQCIHEHLLKKQLELQNDFKDASKKTEMLFSGQSMFGENLTKILTKYANDKVIGKEDNLVQAFFRTLIGALGAVLTGFTVLASSEYRNYFFNPKTKTTLLNLRDHVQQNHLSTPSP